MLQVSNAAKNMLKDELQDDDYPSDQAVFRLVIANEALALAKVPFAEDGDMIYEQDGIAVLAAPPNLADELASQIIDVEETGDGTRLVVVQQ